MKQIMDNEDEFYVWLRNLETAARHAKTNENKLVEVRANDLKAAVLHIGKMHARCRKAEVKLAELRKKN